MLIFHPLLGVDQIMFNKLIQVHIISFVLTVNYCSLSEESLIWYFKSSKNSLILRCLIVLGCQRSFCDPVSARSFYHLYHFVPFCCQNLIYLLILSFIQETKKLNFNIRIMSFLLVKNFCTFCVLFQILLK